MAAAVVCWSLYLITYLDMNNFLGKAFKVFGWAFFALDAGMDDHLAKPVDIPKLLSTLSKLKKQ